MPALPVRPRRTIKDPARIMDLIEEFEEEYGIRILPYQPEGCTRIYVALLPAKLDGLSLKDGETLDWGSGRKAAAWWFGLRRAFDRFADFRGLVIGANDSDAALLRLIEVQERPTSD